MQFSEVTYDGGLSEMINRICGTTNIVYTNKAKVVDINNALDKYFALGNYQFEDNNQSTVPVETIDLVDGNGDYALEDLTSELLNFLRVEITDDDGNDFIIRPIKLSNIGEPYDKYYSDSGIPQVYIKSGKYIRLKPTPNYNETGGLKIYFDRPASKYTFVAFTTTFATDIFNATTHGLSAGDAVIFETDGGDLPSGLTEDTVVYYVIASGLTADVFKVSTTIGGSTITLADNGTGNHKFLKVSRTPGIPTIHHPYLARKASLEFLGYKKLGQYNSIARQVVLDEEDIKQFFGNRNKDEINNFTMQGIAHR